MTQNNDHLNDCDFTTRAIHAGESDVHSAVPIHQSATSNGVYTRNLNPTIAAFENKIAALTGGEAACATACGMAAVSQTLLAHLSAGDRIVVHRCVYVGVHELLTEDLVRFGIDVCFVDMRNLENLKAAVAQKPTKIVYFEPYANPSMDIIDAAAAIEIAHAAGALAVIDNTLFTPYLFNPLHLGADLEIHSATKYLCGHGDTLGGAVAGREELIEPIIHSRVKHGGVMAPLNAFLLLRGIKTLPMRMDRHCASAQQVAEFLAEHPKVAAVRYAGLPDYPGHNIIAARHRGFTGIMAFQTVDENVYEGFVPHLKLCKAWVSLGDAQTLLAPHDPPQKHRGIDDNYVRISVGLEAPDDIIADLKQALDKA